MKISLKLGFSKENQENTSKGLDEKIVYFILLVYGISTGENSPTDLCKTAGSLQPVSFYSKTFSRIYNLGVKWQYGLARSCDLVSVGIKEEEFKLFIMKIAQVIRLGDDLRSFLRHELNSIMQSYSASYERKLRSMDMLLEMYSTMMSTSSFMVSAMLILAMLSGGDPASSGSNTVMTMFAIVSGLGAFAFILFFLFPKDNLLEHKSELPEIMKLKKVLYMMIGVSLLAAAISYYVFSIPLSLCIVVAGVPLIIPGMMARKIDSQIRKMDDYYPSFVRHLGEVYSTVGSLGQSLKAVLKSDFGMLGIYAEKMHYRILNRVTIDQSFELFSKETGSRIISSGNTIISRSMINGANMSEIGSVIADITSKILEARRKRIQSSKALESTMIIMNVLTLAVFGLMNTLIKFLNDLFSMQGSLQGNSGVQIVGQIDPLTMAIVLPLMTISLAVINALVIKVSQGGVFHSYWYTLAILLIIGGATIFTIDKFLAQMLNSMIDVEVFSK